MHKSFELILAFVFILLERDHLEVFLLYLAGEVLLTSDLAHQYKECGLDLIYVLYHPQQVHVMLDSALTLQV